MNERTRRLTRLQGIRRMQADVEESALCRLQVEASVLEQMTAAHREAAMERPRLQGIRGDATEWHLLTAESVLALHHLERTLTAVEHVHAQTSAQRLRVNDATRECQQMERLVESAARVHMQEAACGEQRMLDDLFSAKRTLQKNSTRFS